MRKQGIPLRQALLHLRACRPIAFPNIGFLVQLKAFESITFGRCSDVPLKLERLFGIEEVKTPATTVNDANLSEEQKSEAKALADAEEQLTLI